MSMQVKSIDTNQAKAELKKCPKIVQDYVRSLEGVYELRSIEEETEENPESVGADLKWKFSF